MLPLLLLIVFAVLLAGSAGVLHAANRKLKAMEPKRAAVIVFGQYLKLLSLQGIVPEGGETPATFAERVNEQFGFSGPEFQRAAEVFQLARFSEHTVSDKQKIVMLNFRERLLGASRKKLGLAHYLLFKFIWGI